MAKWTEVDIYTGLVKKVDEDAPVNFAGQGSKVALPPDVMMKKKKKRLIDARTKEYRQHRARLEKLRAQRQAKTNNMNEEQLDEFKKASVEFDRRNKSDMMKAKKDLEKKGHKVDVSGSMITVTAKRGSDIGREIKDVMNFYNGAKRAKALESVEEENLDEISPALAAIGRVASKAAKSPAGKEAGKAAGAAVGDAIAKKINAGRMKELAMKIADVYTKMKKDRTMKPFADKFRQDVKKSLDIRKSLEKVLPDYVSGGSITKLMAGYENYGEEVELDEGKYLKYSDLLLQKSRLVDKHGPESKEVQAVNKELAKEKKKLGIREEDIKEGTWHIAKNMTKLKKTMKKPMPYNQSGFIFVAKHIGDDELFDDLQGLKREADMVPAIKKAMKRLGIKEEMSFIGKVQEQIDEFGRESLLAENNMEVLKSIVKSKSAKNIKMKDGNLKMDLFTASAIMNIYDKVNPSNKKKIEALANGKKSDLMKLQSMAMKLHKK